LISRPALAILGSKSEWEPVLRKFGKILFLISPDEGIAEYEECYKMCVNRNHFLNSYLFINKTGPKKKAGRSPTQPKLTTSRALQRLSVLIMSGFYLNRFQQLPDDHIYAKNELNLIIKKFIDAILTRKNATNILDALGYDVALRNWIKDHTGSLTLHDKKPQAKKDDQQMQAYLLPIEKNLRNIQTTLESKLESLQEQLREAQKSIKSLQVMQHFFTMHKVTLQGLMEDYEEKNASKSSLAEDGSNEDGEDSDESSDDEMETNEKLDAPNLENSDDEEKNEEEEEDGDEKALQKEAQEESALQFTGSESEAEVDGNDDSSDE
jgi:hypothetical protein